MKQPTQHNCDRTHRVYRALARCIWPRAEWIVGGGRFAVVARCRVTTVSLHRNEDDAKNAKAVIDRNGCGGRCTRWHEIVQLSLGTED